MLDWFVVWERGLEMVQEVGFAPVVVVGDVKQVMLLWWLVT